MNYIILYGAIQSFFMTLLIANKKKKSVADYILGFWLLLIGFHILSYFVFKNNLHVIQKHIFDINLSFPLLNSAFLFMYVNSIIAKTNRFNPKLLYHLIPFGVFVFFMSHNVLFGIKEQTLRYYDSFVFLKSNSAMNQIFNMAIFLATPFYVIWSLFKLHRHRKSIKNNFSFYDKVDLNWLRYLILGLGLVWVTLLGLHVYAYSVTTSLRIVNQVVFTAYTVFVFIISYYGFRQSFVFSNIVGLNQGQENNKPEIVEEKEKYKQSGLKPDQAKIWHNKLIEFMDTKKPYVDNQLTLNKLSVQTDIPGYYISQILSEQQNQSFYDFINSYRVEEFKKRIISPENKDYTLLSVAYDCGFNSKASFNRIFKAATGKTPSEFKKGSIMC